MNIQKLMQEAQKMQNSLKKKTQELEASEFEIKYKEFITIKIKGNYEIVSMDINKDIVDPDDIEMLSDIIVEATNYAIKEVKNKADEITKSVAPGLGGMGGMF